MITIMIFCDCLQIDKMKIAIFGATGQTGMEAVQRALAANHSVTAIVRWESPDKHWRPIGRPSCRVSPT